MELGYDLTIEQSQKLVMTPELIQAIQILQFNTQDLDAFVQEQVLINPVLEVASSSQGENQTNEESKRDGDNIESQIERTESQNNFAKEFDEDKDWRERVRESSRYDDISYRQWEYSKDNNEYSYEQFVTSDVTLQEHLMFQLQFAPIKKNCRNIGRYVIESLDDNGYMTLTREEIATAMGVSLEKVDIVIDAIHGFEPAGIGAQDLKECLLIQLSHRGEVDEAVAKVINEYLEDIAANRLGYIAKELGVTVKEVQEICDLIKSLEPKPGRQFATQNDTRYIVPDVIVERLDDKYVVTINETSTPRLMVSSYYKNLLTQSQTDENLSKYLSGRVNSAIWLIKSIEQRKQTIYNVVQAVVKYQQDFFDNGNKYLKTLTLKQIAEEVGIHESTVSRSINGKYMQSPRGVFEIKYFFTSGVSDGEGEGISSNSIKTFIKEIIDSEDPNSPYSDQDMMELLKEHDINISRRTVAKYRDEMNILSSSKRKRY